MALKGYKTPVHLYNSLDPSLQLRDKHEKFLQNIREVISDRIINEEDRVPTLTSFWHHWLRSCWVSQFWQQSCMPDFYLALPTPESSGWLLQDDGTHTFDWETPEIQQKIKRNIEFFTKGCTCKKGCKKKYNCGI